MTIKKNVLLLSSALLASTTLCAQAAVIEDADLNFVKIDGTYTEVLSISGFGLEEYEGKDATILVLEDKQIGQMDTNSVENQAQVEIIDGKFSLSFELNPNIEEESSGTKTYYTYIKVGTVAKDSSISYTNIDAESTYNIIKNQDTTNKNTNYYRTFRNQINKLPNGAAYNNLVTADKNAAVTMIEARRDNMDTEWVDAEGLKDAAGLAATIMQINKGNPEYAFIETYPADSSALGLQKNEEGNYEFDVRYGGKAAYQFMECLTDAGRANVISAVTARTNYASIQDYIDEFVLQTTIYAIRNNKDNGTDFISDVLSNNNTINGFDLTNYNSNKSTINPLLLNGTYTDEAGLLAVLNTTVTGSDDKGTKPETSKPFGDTTGPSFRPVTSVTDGVEQFVFTDVTANYEWAKEAITALYKADIISGRSKTTYAPAANVTRAEFLKLIMGVMGIEAEDGTSQFDDVKASDWYHDYVVTATKLGLVNGISETEFGSNNDITRQDAAVMIARACEITGNTLSAGEPVVFADADFISEYAKEAVNLLSGAGIVQGSDNMFSPRAECTRAEAAVMLYNVLGSI